MLAVYGPQQATMLKVVIKSIITSSFNYKRFCQNFNKNEVYFVS